MMVQFMRFGVVGGIATAVQYLVLIMLVQWAGIDPVISSALGFTASAFLNYALNYRYTFRSGRSHRQALPRFFAVALSGLSLNTLLMALMVGVLGLNYILAQLTATAAVLFGKGRGRLAPPTPTCCVVTNRPRWQRQTRLWP